MRTFRASLSAPARRPRARASPRQRRPRRRRRLHRLPLCQARRMPQLLSSRTTRRTVVAANKRRSMASRPTRWRPSLWTASSRRRPEERARARSRSLLEGRRILRLSRHRFSHTSPPLPSSVADRPTAGSPSPSPSRIKIVSPSAQSSYSTRIPAADQSSPPRPEHSSPPPPGVPRYGSGKGGAVMAQYRANMPPPRPLSPSPPPSPSQLPSSPPAPFPSLSLAPPLPPPPPQFAPPADDTLPSDISRLSDVDLDDDASVASSSRLTRGAGKGPAAQAPARDVKVESSDEEGHESMEMPDGAMTFVPPRKGPVNPRAEKRPRRPSATSRPKIEAEPAPSLAPAVQPVSKQEPAPVAPAAFAAPPVLKSASPPPAFSLPPQPPVPPANPIASSSTAPVYHQSLPAPVPIPSTYAPKPFVPSIPLPAAHPLSDNPLSVLLPPKGQLNEEGYPMKPPLTYTTLILLSLQAFVEHKATIPEMCEWIMGEFDWYRVNKESGWQVSFASPLPLRGLGLTRLCPFTELAPPQPRDQQSLHQAARRQARQGDPVDVRRVARAESEREGRKGDQVAPAEAGEDEAAARARHAHRQRDRSGVARSATAGALDVDGQEGVGQQEDGKATSGYVRQLRPCRRTSSLPPTVHRAKGCPESRSGSRCGLQVVNRHD